MSINPVNSLVVAACLALGLSSGALSAQNIMSPSEPDLQTQRDVRSTYIVQFNSNVNPSDIRRRASAIAARFGGRITHTYGRVLNGFSIQMNDAAMSRLVRADDLNILSVSRDGIATINIGPPPGKGPGGGGGGGGGGGSTCAEELGWNIERVTNLSQPKTVTNNTTDCNIYEGSGTGAAAINYSGGGLKVCVLDTGMPDHPDLNINTALSSQANFTKGKNYLDENGHSTHVSGIIGAKLNGQGVVGVAPGTEIIAIKVLTKRGSGQISGVIDGVDHAAEIGCDIANMSLTALASESATALDDAVKCASGTNAGGLTNCANNSVIFTLAAGNDSMDIALLSPARASSGATDDIFTIASFGDGDSWSSFSNYDELDANGANVGIGTVDFVLPGEDVKSTFLSGGYYVADGTSMAAPHMAGLLVRYITSGRPVGSSGNFSLSGTVNRTSNESYDIPVDGNDSGSASGS